MPPAKSSQSSFGSHKAQGNLTNEFHKQFQALILAKDQLAQLDDPTSKDYKLALLEFLSALVSRASLRSSSFPKPDP